MTDQFQKLVPAGVLLKAAQKVEVHLEDDLGINIRGPSRMPYCVRATVATAGLVANEQMLAKTEHRQIVTICIGFASPGIEILL